MGMEGDLSSLQVGELLQMLQLGSKSGALLLSRGLEEVAVWMDRGVIHSVYGLRGERLSLASTLYMEGVASEADLRVWRREGAGEESWLERLDAGELVEVARAQALLQRHTMRLLVEASGWSTGHFAFDEKGPGARPAAGLKPPLELAGVLLEVMRRRDDTASVAAECRARKIRFETADLRRGETAAVSPRARRLLGLLGREADIDGIFEACQQFRYEALEAARELLKAQLLLPRSGNEQVSLERTFWDLVPEDLEELDEDVEFYFEEDDEAPDAPSAPPSPPAPREVGAKPRFTPSATSAHPGPSTHAAEGKSLSTEELSLPPLAGGGPEKGAGGHGRTSLATAPRDGALQAGPGVEAHRAAAGQARPGTGAHRARSGQAQQPARRVEDEHHALQRQLRSLTEGLDDLVPELPPYERWKRRLVFLATALTLTLAAIILLAVSLGWHRPLLGFFERLEP